MSNIVFCPSCNKKLKPKPEVLGKRLVCPRCKSEFWPTAEQASKVTKAVPEVSPCVVTKNRVKTAPEQRVEVAPNNSNHRLLILALATCIGLLMLSSIAIFVLLLGGKNNEQHATEQIVANTEEVENQFEKPDPVELTDAPNKEDELAKTKPKTETTPTPTRDNNEATASKSKSPPKKSTQEQVKYASSLEELKAATVFLRVSSRKSTHTGTGFFVGKYYKDGLIVTNAHVARPETPNAPSTNIECVFFSGTSKEQSRVASVIGIDRAKDLALLKVKKNSGSNSAYRPTYKVQIKRNRSRSGYRVPVW